MPQSVESPWRWSVDGVGKQLRCSSSASSRAGGDQPAANLCLCGSSACTGRATCASCSRCIDRACCCSGCGAVHAQNLCTPAGHRYGYDAVTAGAKAPVSAARSEPSSRAAVPPAKDVIEHRPSAPGGKATVVTQEHLVPAAPVRSAPEQRAEPVSQPLAPRQPTGPARSLQEATVVMAVANPAEVRQVGNAGNKQMVQAMLPRSASTAGLFFETPDDAASSKPTAAAKTTASERVWP